MQVLQHTRPETAAVCGQRLLCSWHPSPRAASSRAPAVPVTPALNRLVMQHRTVHSRGLQQCKAATAPAPVLESATQEPLTESIDESFTAPVRDAQPNKFNWQHAWYPVSAACDLDPSRPQAVQLLGKRLVVWRDADKAWRCFEDLCPHRLAPLSEGRIMEGDGSLTCAYHGWRFSGSGNCTHIPQIHDDRAQATATSSSRSCVASFPTQEKNGLLWVWADSSPIAKLQAAATPTCAPDVHDESQHELLWLANWFVRDVPYGADVLAENIMDPSHVQFSHHNVIGNRNAAWDYSLKLLDQVEAATGFQVAQESTQLADKKGRTMEKPTKRTSTITWRPPCLVMAGFSGGVSMVTYVVPTAPGQSRLYFGLTKPKKGAPLAMRLALGFLGQPWLRWREHLSQNAVLDGDNVFLHMQDQELAHRQEPLLQHYFTPSKADVAVRCVRRWYSECAQAIPWAIGAARVGKAATREELLDRFHTHTANCTSCRQAFQVTSWLGPIAASAAALAAVFATAVIGAGSHWHAARVIGSGVVCAAGLLIAAWAWQLRQKLVFVDYVHQDHH